MTIYPDHVGQLQTQAVADTSSTLNLRQSLIGASGTYKLGVLLYCVPLGFDFQDRGLIENPLVLQISIIAISFLGFSILIRTLSAEGRIQIYKSARYYLYLWMFFTFYTGAITFFRGSEFIETLHPIVPFIMMISSMIIVLMHFEVGRDLSFYLKSIIIACVISTFWTFYFGRFESSYFDEDEFAFIEDIRFTILSPIALPLFGYLIYQVSRRGFLNLNALLLVFSTFLFFIAKTRGAIPGLLSAIIFNIFVSDRRIKMALYLLSLVAILFLVIQSFLVARGFELIDVWGNRFAGGNQYLDVTYYTRLAEYAGQMNLLFSDIQSAIFGYGFLTETNWDPYVSDILERSGVGGAYYAGFGVGAHSSWVNMFFAGGLIAGWIPAFGMFAAGLIAVRAALLNRSSRRQLGDDYKAILAMVIAPILPMSFGNAFGARLIPFVLGFLTMYTIAGWEKFRRERSQVGSAI